MRVVTRLRGAIYDAAIVGLTADWYRAVLERLPVGCRLLDVGIGTGSALLAHAQTVAAKDLYVVGVDIDPAYVERCHRAVARCGLSARIEARHESVYDHRGGPYDAAYFSGSFMLLPDPPAALRHAQTLLRPGGRIYFTQTFEHRRSRALELAKPLLRFATTIDFGRVTYEAEFRRAVTAAGMVLDAFEPLDAGTQRSSRLAIAHAADA